MEISPVSNRVYALLVLYDMHTGFFSNALESISDDAAHQRLDTKANHIAWLTGSLVQQRYEVANYLGIAQQQTVVELFRDNQGIKDEMRYPSLQTFIDDWKVISPLLRNALLEITDEQLDKEIVMPGMEMPYFDMLSFIIYREANCIGQVALWRRLLGYDAMKYM